MKGAPCEDGCFALVTYVPEPLAGVLRDLCAMLPREWQADPHVTVLPPRPLSRSHAGVSAAMAEIVENTSPFSVRLHQVCSFPDTNVLYLSVGEGLREIEKLHAALKGVDAGAFSEIHEFLPHLTLADPLSADQLPAARSLAGSRWSEVDQTEFRVDSVDFLWRAPNGGKADWQRIWTRRMAASQPPKPPAQPL